MVYAKEEDRIEARKETMKRYRDTHRDVVQKAQKNYYERNKDKVRARNRERYRKMREAMQRAKDNGDL